MATRGYANFTATDAARHALKHTRQAIAGPRTPQAGRSKYGAVKDTVDGIAFHSKREAAHYRDLLARLRAGDIRGLRCQPRYALCVLVVDGADPRDVNAGTPTDRRLPVCEYVADFEYEESHLGTVWNLVVEDVKGVRTDIYKLKKRMFEAQYGLKIREIR